MGSTAANDTDEKSISTREKNDEAYLRRFAASTLGTRIVSSWYRRGEQGYGDGTLHVATSFRKAIDIIVGAHPREAEETIHLDACGTCDGHWLFKFYHRNRRDSAYELFIDRLWLRNARLLLCSRCKLILKEKLPSVIERLQLADIQRLEEDIGRTARYREDERTVALDSSQRAYARECYEREGLILKKTRVETSFCAHSFPCRCPLDGTEYLVRYEECEHGPVRPLPERETKEHDEILRMKLYAADKKLLEVVNTKEATRRQKRPRSPESKRDQASLTRAWDMLHRHMVAEGLTAAAEE